MFGKLIYEYNNLYYLGSVVLVKVYRKPLINNILYLELDGTSPLLADPYCANSTIGQNPTIWNLSLYLVAASERILKIYIFFLNFDVLKEQHFEKEAGFDRLGASTF